MGPDEFVYSEQAGYVRHYGMLRGLRLAAGAYLWDRARRDYPSPVRWLWVVLVRSLKYVGQLHALALTLLSGVASPLALAQSRTLLQDGAVALWTVGAVLAARGHHPVAIATCALVAVCLKPEALLGVAAGALAAWPTLMAGTSILNALAVWWFVIGGIFGTLGSWELCRALFQKHDHAYGRTHQRGMPHRLLVDLCMVAPFAVLCGPWPREAIAIVAVHALSPVRNVRTIIAAEVLLRMAFVHAAPWWLVLPSFAYDVALYVRLRKVYDPVTDEIRKAVCQ